MKDITLSVDDKNYSFFMELIKNFDFIKVKKTTQNEVLPKRLLLDELKESVDQINLAKEGKVKLKSARQLLNEL